MFSLGVGTMFSLVSSAMQLLYDAQANYKEAARKLRGSWTHVNGRLLRRMKGRERASRAALTRACNACAALTSNTCKHTETGAIFASSASAAVPSAATAGHPLGTH
jgi:hypothetical protein